MVACFERTFDVMRRAIRQAEAVSSCGLQTLATIATALVEYQLNGNSPLLRASALTSAHLTASPNRRRTRGPTEFSAIIPLFGRSPRCRDSWLMSNATSVRPKNAEADASSR